MKAKDSPSVPSPASRDRFAAAYRILTNAIAAHAFPGCAFGVLSGDKVVLQDALGHFTYDRGAPAVSGNTVYDAASITKVAATTAAAMLLYQRGQLNLDTPLGDLLPGFVVGRAPGQSARLVTLRNLLAHNSGLPGYVELFRVARSSPELFHSLLELPLEAKPGERAEYSDPGFMLLGKALEVCMKESLATWVGREICTPLEMTATGFCPPLEARSSIPPTEEDTGWRHRRIQGEVQDEHAWLLNGIAGHAGLFANVPDLLRFAAEVLAAGSSPAKPCLFAPSTVALFSQRQEPEGSSRALGWDTPSDNSSSGQHFSRNTIGHLGFSGCSLWIDLDAEIAVTLLTNRTWPDRQSQLIREVRPAFHDAIREAL